MDSVCGWRGDRACETPRSCFDCLNDGDATCGVHLSGACVSASSAGVVFTPSRHRYCEDQDITCSACRAEWANADHDTSSLVTTNATCTGDNGCVCSASCHALQRTQVLRQQSEWCATTALTPTATPAAVSIRVGDAFGSWDLDKMSGGGAFMVLFLVIGMPIITLLCCCFCCMRCMRNSKARKELRQQEAREWQAAYAAQQTPQVVDSEPRSYAK